MLKGIDPRLNADVLGALRAMGHGDVVALVDTNFPADSVARDSKTGRLLRMENLTAGEAADAILSVMPLDTYVDDFAMRMEVIDAPDKLPAVQSEVQSIVARTDDRPMLGVERFAFYEQARQAYAVIQTGERRFFGCFMLRKGVIPPDA